MRKTSDRYAAARSITKVINLRGTLRMRGDIAISARTDRRIFGGTALNDTAATIPATSAPIPSAAYNFAGESIFASAEKVLPAKNVGTEHKNPAIKTSQKGVVIPNTGRSFSAEILTTSGITTPRTPNATIELKKFPRWCVMLPIAPHKSQKNKRTARRISLKPYTAKSSRRKIV